ncbi:MAG: hypothetical protein KatS3mg078_1895 [Deltaproteobacteria bacterium]|jgi:hypothetical protein|nr:MAG: hypothetical protein KatS3mg078_1895 [Deltaproteobacteria bacterium]
MAFPNSSRMELPILQELNATGGEERVRVLYSRLVPYFPQLTDEDLKERTKSGRNRWRMLVNKAGQSLVKKGEIRRYRGSWRLTEKGKERIEQEALAFDIPLETVKEELSHDDVKKKLIEIGLMLGKYAEEEYNRFDVIWKESKLSPRISHVFEVQIKGKIESALAKLKHAYDVQRSKPFLVISDELNSKKANRLLYPHLSGSFHEIGDVTTILSVGEVKRVYNALSSIKNVLEKFFE